MVYGLRRGRFRKGRKGRHSSRGRQRSNGRRNDSRTANSRKGYAAKGRGSQAPSRGVVAYSIYNSRGRRTYVGTSNNPARRAAQHAKSGRLKRGGALVVESNPMSRSAAERLEAKKIQGYRSKTGRLPRHNKTPDGQFHRWG